MNTLKHFYQLARPFWGGKGSLKAWLLLAAVIGFALAIVRVSVYITAWNKDFYDALEQFNRPLLYTLLWQYLGYIAFTVGFVVLGNWLRKILVFRWREQLTEQFTQMWLARHRAYRLQIQPQGEPDNPDQRIAEDCFLLADKSIDLFKYFIMNAAKLGAFVIVLWQLSGSLKIDIGGKIWVLHGYLVWVALGYTLVCTLATHLIGRKLHPLNIDRQHREADYRANLLRVRDHAEQIAFYRGENTEHLRLRRRFAAVRENWHALIERELRLETFSATYLRITQFIPIAAALPLYLAHTLTFGGLMQARSAFGNVQDGFGWFMDYYKRIMEWAAVVSRLADFQAALDDVPTLPETELPQPQDDAAASVQFEQMVVRQNRPINAQIGAGEYVLLDGKSGAGKTSLLRVLAGLTAPDGGSVRIMGRTLFLPQKPYLALGSLKNLLSYPSATPLPEDAIRTALAKVGLARLNDELDAVADWQARLSGGEQQRIGITRALLHRPQILAMDEPTAALDDASAEALFALLQQELPHTAVLCATHQAVLRERFARRIELLAEE